MRASITARSIVAEAAATAECGGALVLVGPPGQGKSWVCQRVMDALQNDGWLVAEHYCYLGDADASRHSRANAEIVFGSLLHRLVEGDPSLADAKRPRLAADERSLVQVIDLALARVPQRRIALIVDGLDHVTRVLGSTTGQPDPSARLAHDLAALPLPPGSVLIVASQPGGHLRELHAAGTKTLQIPAWRRNEVGRLAGVLGVSRDEGTRRDHQKEEAFVTALHERSGGNPLYATYLCRELLRSPVRAAADAVATISELPAFDGTLESYYAHLTAALGPGRWVADIVALPAFGVSRAELREIYPDSGHVVDDALELLAPVLVERSAQGGRWTPSTGPFSGPRSLHPDGSTELA